MWEYPYQLQQLQEQTLPEVSRENREDWIAKREAELLPVPYFHVVFTLPDTLNQLAMHQPKAVYNSLFEAAWQTVACFAKDPKHLGAKPGMIAILHTWGQTMSLHPHLHCIVPGGGLTKKEIEDSQKQRQIPLPGEGYEQGIPGEVCKSTQVKDRAGERTDQSALPKRMGGIRQTPVRTSQSGIGIPR